MHGGSGRGKATGVGQRGAVGWGEERRHKRRKPRQKTQPTHRKHHKQRRARKTQATRHKLCKRRMHCEHCKRSKLCKQRSYASSASNATQARLGAIERFVSRIQLDASSDTQVWQYFGGFSCALTLPGRLVAGPKVIFVPKPDMLTTKTNDSKSKISTLRFQSLWVTLVMQ
jgi:hypothetical protein